MLRGPGTVQALDPVQDRYVVASFGRNRFAVPLGCIERVVRGPDVKPWVGRGLVQGFVSVDRWVVWLLHPGTVFPALGRVQGRGEWLLVLREELGLSRLGVLAEDVRGPIGQTRIDGLRILQRRANDELEEAR